MTPQEAIDYIENYSWSSTRLGLDRTRELLERLGNPQKRLKFVHVAGSNGKGSTCAMLESILRTAGYRTGLYTSPYIQDFCERMQVCGRNIDGEDLARLTGLVKAEAERMEDHPSQFELVTALAMQYFLEQKCDIVVLEVGMGGAMDATNVIDAPEAAVITNIGLEHTEYLGDTLEKIALHKAGIIKPGCSAVVYDGEAVVTETVGRVCEKLGVSLKKADFSKLESIDCELEGQRFGYRGAEYAIGLLGGHQLCNAAVVLETVGALRERGWNISDGAVLEGLRTAQWPARLELLSRAPLFLLDGGHNPQCAQALAASLTAILPGRKAVILAGVLADKDYSEIVDTIMPYASEFVCVTPLSGRALPGDEYAEFIRSRGGIAEAKPDIESGIMSALEKAGEDGAVIAFGSLYMAGAVRTLFLPCYRKWLRKRKIRARNSLTPEERESLSFEICGNIAASPEFRSAGTVMIYKAVKGEFNPEALTSLPEASGKRFVYPLCTGPGEMRAYLPETEDCWRPGFKNIPEPDPEKAAPVSPEEIDMVICPCSSFDEKLNRMGMGGGYYDRYLPLCGKSFIAAAAFEAQKSVELPAEAWDVKMKAVFTEKGIYR